MSEEFRRRFKVWKKWSKRNTNSWLHKILVLFGVVHSPTFRLEMAVERYRENLRAAEAVMKGLTLGIKFGEDPKVLDKEKVEKLIKRGTRAEMSMVDESSGTVTDDLDDEELDGVVDNFCGTVTDDLDKWAKGTPLEVQDDE